MAALADVEKEAVRARKRMTGSVVVFAEKISECHRVAAMSWAYAWTQTLSF